MSFVFSLLLLLILAACVGVLYKEGMWDNAVRLVNVVVAGVLATAWFEFVAYDMKVVFPSYVYLVDYLTIWTLFCIYYVVLRAVTGVLSRVQVRFLKLADRIGGVVFSALVGWVMVAFTLTTFHTAPLGTNFFFEAFQPNEPMFLGLFAPDREWLGFVARLTGGVYGGENVEPLDPDDFIDSQTQRRAALEAHLNKTGRLRIDPEKEKPALLAEMGRAQRRLPVDPAAGR
ncbi:MAG: CvpA family protein [Thermoguttaceae bacterium]|jgi:hypothetical protein